MTFDPKYAQERFSMMTREELLDEVALHTDQYVPMALKMLEGAALDRGITAAEIAARRDAAAGPAPPPDVGIDHPALLTSSADRADVEELAAALRRDGMPAEVHEVDARRFHGSGHAVGRWGLFVAGAVAADAARRLDALFPADACAPAPGCGGCGGGSCGGDDADALVPGDWDENGDWWKTGAPGEEDQ